MARPIIGDVISFDGVRGIGEIRTTDGALVRFHATAISDGSRSIEEGAAVSVLIGAGHAGRSEALEVVKLAR